MGFVRYEQDGFVGIVTIDRPKALNALNEEVLKDLEATFDAIDLDNTRAVIVTGEGKSFVAGADIGAMSTMNAEEGEAFGKFGNDIFRKIETFPIPVIAAVNGFALGGGLELAMSCHIRYASENAKLGLPEVTLGLIPGYGGTQRLPKLVGKGLANELIFSAKMISAQRAKEIGLVNEVFSLEELLPKAKELANQIANNSPMAISKAIIAVNQYDTDKGFETEIKSFGELFEMDDKKEGVAAFLEKRKPSF